MTTHTNYEDNGLLGTFAVITHEEWEQERSRLTGLSMAGLWISYEHLLEDIQFDEWHLGDPDSFMPPEEIPERIIQWDKERQFRELYEEVLRERGWDGEGPPENAELPHCNVCHQRIHHWDKEDHVCDECRQEMWRDEWREEQRRWW